MRLLGCMQTPRLASKDKEMDVTNAKTQIPCGQNPFWSKPLLYPDEHPNLYHFYVENPQMAEVSVPYIQSCLTCRRYMRPSSIHQFSRRSRSYGPNVHMPGQELVEIVGVEVKGCGSKPTLDTIWDDYPPTVVYAKAFWMFTVQGRGVLTHSHW